MKLIFLNLIFIFLFLFPDKGFATAQIPDKIIFNGKEESLLSNPLEFYFKTNPDKRPERENMIISTALWRGYIATFEVINNELFVKDIIIQISQDENNNDDNWISVYNEVFNKTEPTKVDWLNGLLVIPHGEIINYVHMGYGTTYENYTILEISNGNLTKEKNLNYREYEVFKENQFQVYKKTKEYEEKVKMFQNEGERDIKFLNSFLKNFVIEYTSKILDDSEIIIEEVKKEFDKRLVGEWYGEENDKQEKGLSKKWKMKRNSDGTYKIEFELTQDGQTYKKTEFGEWWTVGNKFYEFNESSGMTDEYEFEVLNKKKVKFKMIKTDSDFEDEAYTFIDTKVKSKKTETGFKGEWFAKLKETNGIYEFRERDSKYFYRILAFWDSENDKETLILATHGFDKKTNKTPKSEIKRAESIKETYFINKRSNNDISSRI